MLSLVTGGTGFVGSHLVEWLLETGRDVRAIVRPGRKAPNWLIHPRISLVQADLLDQPALSRALAGVGDVYHVAGAVKALSLEAYYRSNAATTYALLSAAAKAGTSRRFVLISSQAAAGPSRPHPSEPASLLPVGEDDGYAPISEYGQSKLAAEVIVRQFRDRVPATIVRPPTAYGPRDTATLPFFRLAQYGLKLGLDPSRVVSLVHVADLVQGITLAAEADVPSGRTYFLPGPEDASLRELMALISRVAGRRGFWLPVPDRAVHVAGGLAGAFSRLTGRAEIFGPAKAREITAPGWRCDGSRARAELGYDPRISLEAGIAATTDWYRREGWVR